MKKAYVTPEIEKIEFQYRDQVVAASGHQPGCEEVYSHATGAGTVQDCTSGDTLQSWTN